MVADDVCRVFLGRSCSTILNAFCRPRSFHRKQREREWNQSEDWVLEQMVGNGYRLAVTLI